MKVLWLSTTPGLLHENVGTGNYGGSGWIASLQRLFCKYNSVDKLALAYISETDKKCTEKDNVKYYPIYSKPKNTIQKIREYYGAYKNYDRLQFFNQINAVILEFNPDIIHLFGLENPLATILGKTNIPIVVHMQGLLGPVDNAFFPVGFSYLSLLWPPTKREWLYRNGFGYAKKSLHTKAINESRLFKDALFFMGRTTWDMQVSKLLSPQAKYFKVNEVLRKPFYDKAQCWTLKKGKLAIVSTISETMYKGLDLILKTASILCRETNLDFEWKVVGVDSNSLYVSLMEKLVGVKSSNVFVSYLGVLSAQQLADICMSSMVYVHPSYIDNSPNSICEAQLIGIPVIATNVGGVSSLVTHQETGLLIPANAPFELAYWLKELYYNEELIYKLSTNGCISATMRHDERTIIDSLLNVYNSVIQKSNGN